MSVPDAAYYARVAAWSGTPRYATEVRALLARLDLPDGARVLDLGCGTGTAIRFLEARGCQPIGLDRPAAWMAACEAQTRVRADGVALPFPPRSFDAVLLVHVLSHLDDPPRCLSEAHRVLRPGGRIGLLSPNALFLTALRLSRRGDPAYVPDPTVQRHYTLSHARRMLRRAGFEIETAVRIGDQPLPVPVPLTRERLLLIGRRRGACLGAR